MRHLNEEKEVLLRFYRKKFALADATLGRRRMSGTLLSHYSIKIGEKTYKRLKKQLGLRTLYPIGTRVHPACGQRIEPYLLNNITIKEADHVWTSDITYIQIEQRNYYLCVVMVWDSRFLLG